LLDGAHAVKIAVMQPYFLPYAGYFQLIAAVDRFVVYDDIKYTKKGWINRNRMLVNGAEAAFSLPLKNAPDALDIGQREVAEFDRAKLLNRFRGAYARAPHFAATMELLERIVDCPESNLFSYLKRSLELVCAHIGIDTRITVSSTVTIAPGLRSEERVLAYCKALGALTYVNAIGGRELYSAETFAREGIALKFIESRPFEYRQFAEPFIPWLSIADVLMFNAIPNVRAYVTGGFDLV
jgi:hypothetical protein